MWGAIAQFLEHGAVVERIHHVEPGFLVEGLDQFENSLTANPVTAAFNCPPTGEVYLPTKQRGQLLLHGDVVEQTPFSPWRKSHEHVHITLRSEVVAQHGAKERQLYDLPSLAKCRYFLALHSDSYGHNGTPGAQCASFYTHYGKIDMILAQERHTLLSRQNLVHTRIIGRTVLRWWFASIWLYADTQQKLGAAVRLNLLRRTRCNESQARL